MENGRQGHWLYGSDSCSRWALVECYGHIWTTSCCHRDCSGTCTLALTAMWNHAGIVGNTGTPFQELSTWEFAFNKTHRFFFWAREWWIPFWWRRRHWGRRTTNLPRIETDMSERSRTTILWHPRKASIHTIQLLVIHLRTWTMPVTIRMTMGVLAWTCALTMRRM